MADTLIIGPDTDVRRLACGWCGGRLKQLVEQDVECVLCGRVIASYRPPVRERLPALCRKMLHRMTIDNVLPSGVRSRRCRACVEAVGRIKPREQVA